MAVLPIRVYGDPILKHAVESITEFNEELVNLVDDMIDTMLEGEGIGLAANQVGIAKNAMTINLTAINENYSPIPLMNVEILEKTGNVTGEEGCLSLPDIRENIDRAQYIKIKYQDIFGETKEMECQDLLARVIQHEYDHLHGILIIDRISSIQRQLLKSKLQKIAKEVETEQVRA